MSTYEEVCSPTVPLMFVTWTTANCEFVSVASQAAIEVWNNSVNGVDCSD